MFPGQRKETLIVVLPGSSDDISFPGFNLSPLTPLANPALEIKGTTRLFSAGEVLRDPIFCPDAFNFFLPSFSLSPKARSGRGAAAAVTACLTFLCRIYGRN